MTQELEKRVVPITRAFWAGDAVSRSMFLPATVVVLFAYIVVLSLATLSTQRAANVLFSTDVSSTLAGGENGLKLLDNDLQVFDYRYRRLKILAFPARQVAKLVIVVPPLDRQRQGIELLFDRIDADVEAAFGAVKLGRSTFVLRSISTGGLGSIAEADGASAVERSLVDLGQDAALVLDRIEKSSVIGAEFDRLDLQGPIAAVGMRMDAQEQSIGDLARFSESLVALLSADLDLVSSLRESLAKINMFLVGEASIESIATTIQRLSLQTSESRDLADEVVRTAPAAVMKSNYGGIVADLFVLNDSAYKLMSSFDLFFRTGMSAIDSISSTETSILENGQAISDALSLLIEEEDELARAAEDIDQSLMDLSVLEANGSISLGALGTDLTSRLEPFMELSSVFQVVPRIMADMFGIDGTERRYLLLGQTSDELRATGGFTSSLWLLTFRGGALVENEYIAITSVENSDSLEQYPAPYDALNLHMNAGRMYLRDVGWNPHFPAVGELAIDVYEIGRDHDIDGVIALTQWGFIDLVTAVGGVETDSGLVISDNTLEILERETDEQGTEFLSDLFDGILSALFGDSLRDSGINVLQALNSLTLSKDLMFYSEDPDTQALISEIQWDGGIYSTRNDRLAIVDSNVGWNKVDRNIDRSYEYQVDLSDVENPTANLNLVYTNNSEIGTSDCERQQHIYSLDYRTRLNDCYWNFLRIYVPIGSELSLGDAMPLAEGAIAVQVHGLDPGVHTLDSKLDESGRNFSGLFALEPGKSQSLSFSYALPKTVITERVDLLEYSLDVLTQPGVRGRDGLVEIIPPNGYELVESDHVSEISSNNVILKLNMPTDQYIRLKFRSTDGK